MRVLVIGGGKSGISARDFLVSRGHDVVMFTEMIDLCVVSPGVQTESELDLAFDPRFGGAKPAKIVAVTGTNGKTSTVNMIKNALGDGAVLCGNVGIPVTAVADEMRSKVAVVEVSSFQLEIPPRHFRPDISVILNVTQDHLDRHGTMDEYRRCKNRVKGRVHFENISNADAVRAVCNELGVDKDKTETAITEYGALNKQNRIEYVGSRGGGCDPKRVGSVAGQGGSCGVLFYNDSKATNIASTIYACEKLAKKHTGAKINLILGGIGKGQNFRELFEKLPSNVNAVFVIGRASADIIAASNYEKGRVFKCRDLGDAVTIATETWGEKGGVAGDKNVPKIVLLSPACSSFDMFRDYEDRGEKFKKIVRKIIEKK